MRTFVASLVMLAVLGVGAAPALADKREEARRAFSAGQHADKAQQWRQAIEHYLRAFELVPHHFAAYNIAIDYEHLGELREASVWLNRYLELAPDAPDRDQVMRLMVELKLRPAKLTVRSSPSGATVFIDGQKVGVTPYERPIRGGGRRVAVELRGVRDERDVVLEFGEPQAVSFRLSSVPAEPRPDAPGTAEPGATELEIRGTPVGANVAIDGQVIGTLPTRVVVTPGPHHLHVTQGGYAPHVQVASAVEHQVTPIDVNLGIERAGPKVFWFVGAAGGADTLGRGESYLLEVGVRALNYDLSARAGKALGETSIEGLVRVAYGQARVVPFVAIGYSYIGGASAWEYGGGVRFDLVRRKSYGASILAELAVRPYSIEEFDLMTMMSKHEAGSSIPILISFQLMMGKS
ncbi:MAG: PEGA domain-containing protein [Kofleriaceae bacterium]|nr:PEGA domain-containing protein [Kofleriaceae bacterium]